MTKLLDQMRRNPRGDWTIRHIEIVCRTYGIGFQAPRSGGSHYKLFHRSAVDILTIPSKRPIKPVYIRKLVKFLDALGNPDEPS